MCESNGPKTLRSNGARATSTELALADTLARTVRPFMDSMWRDSVTPDEHSALRNALDAYCAVRTFEEIERAT